jgi:hypothetical protein
VLATIRELIGSVNTTALQGIYPALPVTGGLPNAAVIHRSGDHFGASQPLRPKRRSGRLCATPSGIRNWNAGPPVPPKARMTLRVPFCHVPDGRTAEAACFFCLLANLVDVDKLQPGSGPPPRGHLVEHDAEGEDVRPPVQLLAELE